MKVFKVSWYEDETEFVVLADSPEDAKRRFVANRDAADALAYMREEAEDVGMPTVEDGVHVEELTATYGHEVFSLDGEL